MKPLKKFFILWVCLVLTSCAAGVQTASSKLATANNIKVHDLNVIYIDHLQEGDVKVASYNRIVASHTEVTREKFAKGVLNAVPSEFQAYNLKALAKEYALTAEGRIDVKEINDLFPDSKTNSFLIINPTKISVSCYGFDCKQVMEVTCKILDVTQKKIIWESKSVIGNDLLSHHAFITNSETARKFVKTLAEKMKADGLF